MAINFPECNMNRIIADHSGIELQKKSRYTLKRNGISKSVTTLAVAIHTTFGTFSFLFLLISLLFCRMFVAGVLLQTRIGYKTETCCTNKCHEEFFHTNYFRNKSYDDLPGKNIFFEGR
jgi:hypothetical protein